MASPAQPSTCRKPARCRGLSLPALAGLLLSLLGSSAVASTEAPYTVKPGLFVDSLPDLGLRSAPGLQTSPVFIPGSNDDHYHNGACLVAFKGRLYVQWQSSARDEDSPDTWVAYASSADSLTWTRPQALSPAGHDGEMRSSGGWWTDGRTLVAFINVWPTGFQSGAGGHTSYLTSEDGLHWDPPRRVLDHADKPLEGVIEQDIHSYEGRLHVAFHVQPGVHAKPYFTDDSMGLRGWTRGQLDNLPYKGTTSRELEPSLFQSGGRLVMVFRDQASSFRQLAAESPDRGLTWTTPVITSMPDSRAKQSAGNLPDGTAYLVNCPRASKERHPLAITLSADGRTFTRSLLLRGADSLPPLLSPGKFKRPGYHYPKSLVVGDRLYVVYATNKERIDVSSLPLTTLIELLQPPSD